MGILKDSSRFKALYLSRPGRIRYTGHYGNRLFCETDGLRMGFVSSPTFFRQVSFRLGRLQLQKKYVKKKLEKEV